MKVIWFVAVAAAAWFVGIFGWAQIIGSIQHRYERRASATATTIIIWIVILAAVTVAVHSLLRQYFVAYLVGLGVSFLKILFSGRIE